MTSYRAAFLSFLVLALACAAPISRDGVPEEVMRQNILGTAYLGQQKWTEAETAFQAGLEKLPGEPLLLNNLAVALTQQGRMEEAEATLARALEIAPDHPYAHYNMGLSLKSRGEFEQAVGHFEAVARHDPQDLLTQYNLGVVLSRVDRGAEAEVAFRKALDTNPVHVSTLYALGRQLLQRGETEEGAELLELSQKIRERSGLDEAVGSQYGEQGPYAMGVDFPGNALSAPPAVPLSFSTGASLEIGAGPASVTLAPIGDDGHPVALLAGDGGWYSLGTAGASDTLPFPEAAGTIRWVAAGDLDGDGAIDLVAFTETESDQRYSIVATADPAGGWTWGEPAPIPAIALRDGEIVHWDGTLVDHDHDGDLDLFSCWSGPADSGCMLGTNDGEARFDLRPGTDHEIRFDGAGDDVRTAFSDYDNDRDIDLLLGAGDGLHIFINERDGRFPDARNEVGLDGSGPIDDLELADLDKDGWMDLITTSGGELELRYNRRGRFEGPTTPLEASGPVTRALVADLDNDGFLDLAGGSAGSDGFVLRNEGLGEWSRIDGALEATGGLAPDAAFDADGDGDLDLLADGPSGWSLLVNELDGPYRWLRIASVGVGDNRAGVGAKVEVLAGALRQKFEVVDGLPLHVGVGKRDSVESIRYLWPSGVLQDEIEQPTGETVEITQLDRKGTSCPLLYAWREGNWQFVTDFLGGCAIGYLHAPGVYSRPDTDEYVKIEGGLDPDGDGHYRVRMNNQLQEVIWFDQAELVVVDHPAGTEVYPNERLMPGPPWPEFALFASESIRPLAAARGLESGKDLAPALAERDRVYVDDFERLRFKGYAEPHTVEFDLGPLPRDRRVVLLLDGWIDYADSTANRAAHQAGMSLMPPRLTVADGAGGWNETGHRMGFPAGLPKTMAVELTGLFPSGDARIRIATNMRIYWDRARVMLGGEATPLTVSRVPAHVADLRFGGFPQETSPDGRPPFAYDPERVALRSPWKAHVGGYTPFGEVGDRLATVDDRLVTTRAGDEIELLFPAPAPPGPGMTRTFLLYADGFGKDMDPNSAANNRVEPIPFHGMPVYPYGDDVAPPIGSGGHEATRRVIESPRGWPGAWPQALASRDD